LTSPLQVKGDPRQGLPPLDLDAQLAFSLRVRDTITKLTELVHSMRSVKEQLAARAKALESRKSEAPIADLLKAGETLVQKIDALEEKLHNPKAEVSYDILAARGGARLYSRLSPLQMWTVNGEGAPTQGMQQVLAEYEKELAPLENEVKGLMSTDVADINARAKNLGVEFVVR
jgi:predicted  nucleic acid-binding Zn-ribbon protein